MFLLTSSLQLPGGFSMPTHKGDILMQAESLDLSGSWVGRAGNLVGNYTTISCNFYANQLGGV